MHTSNKLVILNSYSLLFITTYIRIKQHGTHQSMMFHSIQALLDMSQRSHTFIS